jgi:hypothetical protein
VRYVVQGAAIQVSIRRAPPCRPAGEPDFKGALKCVVKAGKVPHTYPITLGVSNPSPKDADHERAALNAVRTAKLVPEPDFAGLKTRMHVATRPVA